jgi:hypothetical protein
MQYYFINTDARYVPGQPHNTWIEKGLAFTGGRIHYGQLLGKLVPGDILFMYANRIGIVAVGRVLAKWDGQTYRLPYTLVYQDNGDTEYRILVDWFADLRNQPIERRIAFDETRIAINQTLNRIPDVKRAQRFYERCLQNASSEFLLPEELSNHESYLEGAKHQITINAYERNREARLQCIAHYGAKCAVCGLNLADRYGEAARDLIHVHHLRELAQIGDAYQVDPIQDLCPVCPNCHAVIHRHDPAYTIEEVRGFLR